MFGCYDPVVIYGVVEADRDRMLARKWLAEHHPNVQMYATDVVRCYMGFAAYGVRVELGGTTGVAAFQAEADRADADRLAAQLGLGPCQYHLAMMGDYETAEHEEYTP